MCIIFSPTAETKTSSKPKPQNQLSNNWFIEVTRRIHVCTTHNLPPQFLKQFTHMPKHLFLRVKPYHYLPPLSVPSQIYKGNKRGGTHSKVNHIIHLIHCSEISKKRTWSILDWSPWDHSSLECRIVTDGCDDIIDDKEFCILPRCFLQFGEDLGEVWVTPVMKDLFFKKKNMLYDFRFMDKIEDEPAQGWKQRCLW